MLGATAAGFFPGTLLARHWAERYMDRMLAGFGLAAACTVIVFMTERPRLLAARSCSPS